MKTNLQNKWRLPTIEEFEKVIYPNKDEIPNLKKDSSYWSSSEYSPSVAWAFYFFYNRAHYSANGKLHLTRVRAVRDVSSDSPNSSNSTIIGNLEIHNEDLGKMNWQKALVAINKLNYE
jgi:hypothetical protein